MTGAVRPLPAGLELGDEFRIERALGSGTFGITYLVKALTGERGSLQAGRHYVVKELAMGDCVRRGPDGVSLLPVGETDSDRQVFWNHFQESVEKFDQEARTLARLNHRGVVEVLLIQRANATAYMVMEHIDGEELFDLMQRTAQRHARALVWEELKPKVPILLDALSHVHKADVIHRDLKPQNIMLRKDGSPVLIDFGGARQARAAHKSMVLTPGVAAREQIHNMRVLRREADGELMKVGPAADIYGMAACFYWALTGSSPYEIGDRLRVVQKRPRLQDHPNLSRMGLPQHVARAIDWALNYEDPSARPQSVDAWRQEFGPLDPTRPSRPDRRQDVSGADQLFQKAEALRQQSGNARAAEYARLYREAAENGHADAAYRFGRLLQLGTGVQKDSMQAERYFLMAAERGDIRGAFRLAESQLMQSRPTETSERAFQLIEAAAKQGFAPAINLVGRYHRKGFVVHQNDRLACDWYERALRAGDPDAAHNLATMYARGLGRSRDSQLSEHLLKAEKQLRSGQSVDEVLRGSPLLVQSLNGS